MAKTKSLAGVQGGEPYLDHIIEFKYKDRSYSAPIQDNLVLKRMSADQIKKHLNEIPGKLAYWSDFKIQIELEAEELEADFENWINMQYMEIDTEYGKKTETWKKAKIQLDNATEYRVRKKQIVEIKTILKKVGVLTSGYTNQVWTLREIGRLTTAEMSNLEVRELKGRGSLADH